MNARILLVIAAALALPAQSPAARADERMAVVELFTSQGCSSCPPADAFAGELAARADIVALTYHVDYWDYIGWKDTFASPATTARQRAYGAALGQRYVYTPEMVINGRRHAVGSDRTAVLLALREAAPAALPVALTQDGGGNIMVSLPPGRGRGDVLLVRYDRVRTENVQRGENAGRALTYFNVVRDVRSLGQWTGAPFHSTLTMAALRDGGADGCAVLVQAPGNGPILGAVRMDLPAGS